MRSVDTLGAEQTESLGERAADLLVPADVVLVSGELGSGKTTLIRGACGRLGVQAAVTSPTFSIGHRYEGKIPVSHLDLYRLGSLEAEDPGLLADYLGPERIAFLEWPEAAQPWLGQVRLHLHLEHLGGDRRRIELRGAGADTLVWP